MSIWCRVQMRMRVRGTQMETNVRFAGSEVCCQELYNDDIQIMTVHYPLLSRLTYLLELLCLLLRDDTTTTTSKTRFGHG